MVADAGWMWSAPENPPLYGNWKQPVPERGRMPYTTRREYALIFCCQIGEQKKLD